MMLTILITYYLSFAIFGAILGNCGLFGPSPGFGVVGRSVIGAGAGIFFAASWPLFVLGAVVGPR